MSPGCKGEGGSPHPPCRKCRGCGAHREISDRSRSVRTPTLPTNIANHDREGVAPHAPWHEQEEVLVQTLSLRAIQLTDIQL